MFFVSSRVPLLERLPQREPTIHLKFLVHLILGDQFFRHATDRILLLLMFQKIPVLLVLVMVVFKHGAARDPVAVNRDLFFTTFPDRRM